MKIIFKEIRYKNFLSTGDKFTRIKFEKGKNTLITGRNGFGKSSFEDSICFTLFNKPFRSVNRNNLVNSRNKSGLLTEVDFDIGDNFYSIRRGIKPNIFDIIKNGKLLDKDSSVWDQQHHLEKNILHMGFKTFIQVVILGSTSYIPFMKLPSPQRRDIVEELLDLKVFSSMYGILKNKSKVLSNEIFELKSAIETNKKIISVKQGHLDSLSLDKDMVSRKYNDKRKCYIDGLKELEPEISNIDVEMTKLITKLHGTSILDNKLTEFKSERTILKNNLNRYKKNISFYEDNDNCPTCKQVIAKNSKKQKVSEYISLAQSTVNDLKIMEDNIEKLSLLIIKVNTISCELNDLKNNKSKLLLEKKNINNQLEAVNLDIQRNDKRQTGNIDDLKLDIDIIKEDLDKSVEMVYNYKNKEMLYSTAGLLLKDSGVKGGIIRRYLPTINSHINKYLEEMGFYIEFTLDENFKETIKSRYLDDFSYGNFSEGEKKRVDLAVLFAWRAVAKMKNSVNTNILVLDEILDSSLDSEGVEYLHEIIAKAEDDVSTIIISHRDINEELFDNIINVKKVGGFSVMEEVN